MSDFDKEAEREKLRKKYERDKQDREATQRMSDLLLKGATMTNTHCDVCGDPLFRQHGTTFCPTCHGGPEGVEAQMPGEDQQADDGADAEESSDDSEERQSSEPRATTRQNDGADERAVAVAGESPETDRTDDDHSRTSDSSSISPPTDAGRPPSTPTRPPGGDVSSADTGNGDLEAATASLVTALERFARAAAETDDPRYAKDCLEAAHEAAEALEALR